MCGIAGIFNFSGQRVSSDALASMSDALRHRGPDDQGFVVINTRAAQAEPYSSAHSSSAIRDRLPDIGRARDFSGDLGLAHNRLSIIDLSSAGHQPFFGSQRSCCVVFNGEIYNYVELRQELRSLGHTFDTQSDTEVLAEAYSQWGTGCFERFNGSWALAIYDFRTRQLILSRDRFGELPLYWTELGGSLYFASEIKALLKIDAIRKQRSVNRAALVPFFYGRKRDIREDTFFDNIFSFPIASYAVAGDGLQRRVKSYWHMPVRRMREADVGIAEAAAAVRETVTSAVELRLRTDVPWCMQLSGGLDSSVLTAAACQVRPGSSVSVYTVRVPEDDEEPYARAVAARYNCEYRVHDNLEDLFWSEVPSFTYLQEEPYVSPVVHVQQCAQRHLANAKVFLSGVAGDELFAGYKSHFFSLQLALLRAGKCGPFLRNLDWTESPSRRAALEHLGTNLFSLIEKLLKHQAKELLHIKPRSYYLQTCPYLQDDLPLEHFDPRSVWSFDYILEQGLTSQLLPYWLRHDDKSMMGIPVEKRAPFLDFRVVDIAMQLPHSYLIRDGWHKWILRKAFEELLPATVVWRRAKLGFPFPDRRFREKHASKLTRLVDAASNPYVNMELLRTSKEPVPSNVMSFLLWYELFFNENSTLLESLAE